VKVGDLVALPRRRNKGIGIILRYKESSERLNRHFKSLSSPSDYWSGPRNDNGIFLGESVEFADAFFLFNKWTNHPPRIKTKFVYIKWFQKPSEYHATKVRLDEGWYPLEWVQKIE
jgi:hypothetical protein